MKSHTTVSVLGLGYIGLPTALLLAKSGLAVKGYDIDQRKLQKLQKNELPFNELGLDALFKSVLRKKNFSASNTLANSDVYVIAVPTPQINGSADLQFVLKALSEIKKVFASGNTVILESTIGPTDCDNIIIPLLKRWKKEFKFVHCPERAIPGNTLHEMVHNDRIIGALDKKSAIFATQLYKKFVKGDLFTTTPMIAAACKVMENTYRAVNIALANEFTQLADQLGFNVWEAIELANKHPRVNIHQPGPGVGGHCIPIDPWFFVHNSKNGVISKALSINDHMPKYVAEKTVELLRKNKLRNPTIGILGYAYKKNVDDSRETPSESIARSLEKKFRILVTDPFVTKTARKMDTLSEVLSEADVIIIATDHDQYAQIKFGKYSQLKLIIDTKNILHLKQMGNAKTVLYTLGKN
jgi:UDP-N-acetyl-D-mannosaminuronic acid dehydrogenase